jgi:hypothetical protein
MQWRMQGGVLGGLNPLEMNEWLISNVVILLYAP